MQVFSARFEGRHGDDVWRVFATREAAIAWRDEIAAGLWADELARYPNRAPRPADDTEAADAAFEFSESYFYLAECQVEGLPTNGLEPGNADDLLAALRTIADGGRPINPIGDPWAFYEDLIAIAVGAIAGAKG